MKKYMAVIGAVLLSSSITMGCTSTGKPIPKYVGAAAGGVGGGLIGSAVTGGSTGGAIAGTLGGAFVGYKVGEAYQKRHPQ